MFVQAQLVVDDDRFQIIDAFRSYLTTARYGSVCRQYGCRTRKAVEILGAKRVAIETASPAADPA